MSAPLGNNFSPGRTPKYQTAEELADKIQEYFVYCEGEFHLETRKKKIKDDDGNVEEVDQEVQVWDRQPEQPRWTALAMFLGFESRQSLTDYAKKESFSYPIKRALLAIENGYEQALLGKESTGAIFALKNFGWRDKQDVELTGKDGGPIKMKVTLNLNGPTIKQ